MNEDAEREKERWLRRFQEPEQQVEWLRQLNVIYGGLIVVGIYMVQPFLTAASLDTSARICVVAFSVAIPVLSALVLVNLQETFRRRATTSVLVALGKVVGTRRVRWCGRRVLAHLVDRRGGDAGRWAGGDGCSFGRRLPARGPWIERRHDRLAAAWG